jgi:tetratricopeptide (TPR) repeat protein
MVTPAVFCRKRRPTAQLTRILFALLILIGGGALIAEDSPYFSVAPVAGIPLASSAALYSFGLGASVLGHFPFGAAGLEASAGLDYQNAFLQAGAGNLTVLKASGGIGWTFLRQEAFSLGVWARTGAFLALYGGSDPLLDPFVSAGLRADFRIANGVSIALEPGYDQLLAMSSGSLASFYSGISAAVRVFIEPAKALVGTRRPKLKIDPPVFGAIFPVAYKYYDTNPLGSVKIENDETAAITDVQVRFFVPKYMQGPTTVATIKEMKRGEVVEIPLKALFSNDVLKITEADSVQSQITVTYTAGKDNLQTDQTASLRMYNRNTITWGDDRRAAAFVTANDPTVKKLSSNAVAAIGDAVATPFTDAMRSAIVLFTALQLYGIQYKVDPNSSYIEKSTSKDAPDYLQFPYQTLDYRTGDCDDMAILFSAMLESVGVEAAFITVPGHIYAAFNLGQNLDAAKKIYSTVDDLIVRGDGSVWIPVETTMLDKGFMAAWAAGAKSWREASANKSEALIPIREAWTVYASTWFGSSEQQDVVERFPKPDVAAKRYTVIERQLAERELAPLVKDLQDRIKTRSSALLINKLGTTYARFGIYDKAETQFKLAAASNYAPALQNLGNLYYLKSDYRNAAAQYEKAKALNPDSALIVISLARARYEMEEWAKAKQLFADAKVLDPSFAESFAYLGGGTTESARAVDVKKRQGVGWGQWGE